MERVVVACCKVNWTVKGSDPVKVQSGFPIQLEASVYCVNQSAFIVLQYLPNNTQAQTHSNKCRGRDNYLECLRGR